MLRNKENIDKALENLDRWSSKGVFSLAEENRILLGRAMLCSALERKESRGAHLRTDFPEKKDSCYRKTTVASCIDGVISVSFRAIPAKEAVE